MGHKWVEHYKGHFGPVKPVDCSVCISQAPLIFSTLVVPFTVKFKAVDPLAYLLNKIIISTKTVLVTSNGERLIV